MLGHDHIGADDIVRHLDRRALWIGARIDGRLTRRTLTWALFCIVAAGSALASLARWWTALSSDIPALYGEGAVVHAGQLIARGADPYAAPAAGTFVAANYPPLAYGVVALLSPLGVFTPYRVVSCLAAVAIALLIAWRARAAPPVAFALAASFLALAPLPVWGSAVKPDVLAVALVAFAVVRIGPSWRDASLAGVLGALAIAAKPTAAVPLALVVAYVLWRERQAGLRTVAALAASLFVIAAVAGTRFSLDGMYTHVVAWNALPYSPAQTGLLLVAGLLTIFAFTLLAALEADGRMRAYLAGGAVVVLLGGREGATVNYLLDLATASCVALAPQLARAATRGPRYRAPRFEAFDLAPLLLVLQLSISAAAVSSGIFAPDDLPLAPARVAHAADLAPAGAHLAEDSGILLANRIEPVVDDLFLWSRLVARGAVADELTPRVTRGEIASVSANVALERLADAPAYERLRWPDALVAAVLARYAVAVDAPGYHRYVPR